MSLRWRQTGTGKTASYGIPVLQKTDASRKDTQAVILAAPVSFASR